jgi:serralysin
MLTGGAGGDTFVWTDLGGTDRISDFTSGSDRIDLSGLDANSGTSGDQAFTFIGASAFGNVAGQLRSYVDGGITYVAGDVDGNGAADFLINLGIAQIVVGDLVL